jgi:hypothetical protein
VSGDGVRVDDRSSSTGNHGPDATLGVEDGELEGGTGRTVELGDVGFLGGEVATETGRIKRKGERVSTATKEGREKPEREDVRRRPEHGRTLVRRDLAASDNRLRVDNRSVTSDSPLGTDDELGGLVKLGSHVEVRDLDLTVGVLDGDEGVDLEVGEVEVDVDGVKADDEVDESLETLSAGNLLEEGSLDLSAGRKLAADGNEEGERLGVDVSDVHTSLVGEEDDVALADRVDADVVLGVGRVRAEGLDDEVVEGTGGLLDLLSAVTSVLRY